MSVHIAAKGETGSARAVKLDGPAAAEAREVLPEWFAETPASYTDEYGEDWYELDSTSCRQRVAQAVRLSVPDERWERAEWNEAIITSWGEVVDVLERLEQQTQQTPLVCITD